jgi:hypothetical protein
VSIVIEGLLARLGENPVQTETRPSVTQTFAGAKYTRLTLARFREFLFAFGRLALAQRMNAARAEIERGRERLWLGPADGEKHLNGAAHEDIARAGTGRSSKTNSDGCHAAETKKAAFMSHPND